MSDRLAPIESSTTSPPPQRQEIFPGLIVREREPENLEYAFSGLNSSLIPNEQFFVRSHFPVPRIDPAAWCLKVEGLIEQPLELTFDQLTQMPAHTVTMVMECAGNSRIFLSPKVGGLQWELGAVGNAEWTGVRISELLSKAGVKPCAVEVVLEGADSGEIKKEPLSPGKINYARSLPMAKAMSPDVLLAYRMNGDWLPAAHGCPLRAIVCGWYGMASVKWLSRIVVSAEPFRGYFQTADYTFWERRQSFPIQLLPVGELEVKAQIARPVLHEIVPAGTIYRIHGAAWAGESQVAKVELSADGGRTWFAAQLLGPSTGYGWRLWEHHWHTPALAGHYTLMARATDGRGRTQPSERDPHRGTYMISHIQPIEIEVRKLPSRSPESYTI